MNSVTPLFSPDGSLYSTKDKSAVAEELFKLQVDEEIESEPMDTDMDKKGCCSRWNDSNVLIQITRKASKKFDIDEITFIQNHHYGQKMITKC